MVPARSHKPIYVGSSPTPASNMARYINWLDSQIHNLKVSSSSLLLATNKVTMARSSRGLGLRIFIPATRIRIPYALQKTIKRKESYSNW